MTLPEADTTPLALTAALLHEAGRTSDLIHAGPGMAKAPWSELTEQDKDRVIDMVLRIRGNTFEEFYEFCTLPFRMLGRPVPEATSQGSDLVRHARMLHGIVHGVLGDTEHERSGGGTP